MTDRRSFIEAIACSILFAAPFAGAQQAPRAARVGILAVGRTQRSDSFYVAFEQRLRELGWVEGKNLVIDFRVLETSEKAADVVRAMVSRRPDVILTGGPEIGVSLAVAATTTIPIVIVALNYDPVAKGYVQSLARPGGNVSGVFSRLPEAGAKQLEFLHQAVPRVKRVAVIWTNYSADQIPAVEAEAARLGIGLDKVEMQGLQMLDASFAQFRERGVGAVLALGDPVVYHERAHIANLGLLHRLPVVGLRAGVEAGLLLGFGADLDATFRRGADYVDKILRGAKPADLPIEQSTKFELGINLKTAKALGLSIPQSLLLRADEVIQ